MLVHTLPIITQNMQQKPAGPASLEGEHSLRKTLHQRTGVWFSVRQQFFVRHKTNLHLKYDFGSSKIVANLNTIYGANSEAIFLLKELLTTSTWKNGPCNKDRAKH